MQQKQIAIFGDSILRGVTLNSNNRYVISKNINWNMIEDRLNCKIQNFSKMGATIAYGYNQLVNFLSENQKVDTVIIEYGGNDCDHNWGEVATIDKHHEPKTTPSEFADYLNKMINLLQERGIKPILMTLPPISSDFYFKWITKGDVSGDSLMPFLGDIETISRHQEYYNHIIISTAHARGIDLVDVRKHFLISMSYTSLMCEDGIHPSERGQDIIMNAFLEKYAEKSCGQEVV